MSDLEIAKYYLENFRSNERCNGTLVGNTFHIHDRMFEEWQEILTPPTSIPILSYGRTIDVKLKDGSEYWVMFECDRIKARFKYYNEVNAIFENFKRMVLNSSPVYPRPPRVAMTIPAAMFGIDNDMEYTFHVTDGNNLSVLAYRGGSNIFLFGILIDDAL
jgi:hypothetical protein